MNESLTIDNFPCEWPNCRRKHEIPEGKIVANLYAFSDAFMIQCGFRERSKTSDLLLDYLRGQTKYTDANFDREVATVLPSGLTHVRLALPPNTPEGIHKAFPMLMQILDLEPV